MLEEDISIGLKVLAQIHSGELEQTCNNCDDYLQNEYACNKILTSADEKIIFSNESLGDFCTCPCKWLNSNVYEFYDEFSYYETFPGTAPSYGKHSVRFWEAVKVYKHEYNSSSVRKTSRPSTVDSDKALQQMRQNFKKGE
jgi:hypothetical protein